MKKAIRLISFGLAVLIIITVLPINGGMFFSASASGKPIAEYEQGDLVEFGSFPQERVADGDLVAALNERATDPDSWTSYGYYSGEKNNIGTMTRKDYMKYTDISFNGVEYRGVYFTSYRPEATCYDLSYETTQQLRNGYKKNTIYWFRYQPLVWVVADPGTGKLVTEEIIDSQPFNNEVYYPADKKEGQITPYFGKSGVYANNYEKSSVRAWLNKEMLNWAFTSAEQSLIIATERDNSAFDSDSEIYNSASTIDKITLMSYAEAELISYSGVSRKAMGSDYALAQGLKATKNKYDEYQPSDYYLRSAGSKSSDVCYVSGGYLSEYASVDATYIGIRPVLNINPSAEVTAHGVVPAESITLNASTTNLYEGETKTLKAEIQPSDSTESISWTTSDSSVATVKDGIVTAVKEGTATITAYTESGKTATCFVSVADVISQFSCSENLAAEQTITFTVTKSFDIIGYYWGTNENAEDNTFTETDFKNVSFAVSEAGTYYLNAVRSDGYISQSRTITLSATTLNANGGKTETGCILYPADSRLYLPIPERTGYRFVGWGSSPDADNGIRNLIPDKDRTFYALWKASEGYTFGKDTYSFKNFSDSDSKGGHCFGLSVTSGAYYNGWLDRSIIGGSYLDSLYSFEHTVAIDIPVCKYQAIQDEYSDNAIVAGGSYYLYDKPDIAADWNEVVNYVRSHDYDNKGMLQIGIRGKNNGHAINFLYYKEVDGQSRIYVYDNNYPEVETYLFMDTDGFVKQAPKWSFPKIRSIALRDIAKYLSLAESYKAGRSIYAESGTISIEGVREYQMECDSDGPSYSMFTLPEDATTATITAEVDGATFIYFDKEYCFGDNLQGSTGTITLVDAEEDDSEEPVFTVCVLGDMDKDLYITVSDARLALRCSIGLEPFDYEAVLRGDINGNGKIEVSDARLILRAAIKLEDPKNWKKK